MKSEPLKKQTGKSRKPRQTSSKDSQVGKMTKAKQDAFLLAYGETGTIRAAAGAVGINRSTVKEWRDRDVQNFKIRFEAANDIFKDRLQDIAFERIKAQKPDGNQVLLITMMNARIPEIYRRDNNRVEDGAREMMITWKKWMKENKNKKPASQEDLEEAESRKNAMDAMDEVEKILSGRKSSDTDKEQ
jgi:hypothetical protein